MLPAAAKKEFFSRSQSHVPSQFTDVAVLRRNLFSFLTKFPVSILICSSKGIKIQEEEHLKSATTAPTKKNNKSALAPSPIQSYDASQQFHWKQFPNFCRCLFMLASNGAADKHTEVWYSDFGHTKILLGIPNKDKKVVK
ncbi:hypothetical protein C5167_027614 [Papaver somniferum]|nr:hypothetical protein C5167_027614 [Papaver somniferum]